MNAAEVPAGRVTADGDLVERLRSRDEAAFAELVERYHDSLLRIARLYVRDHEAAEDVAQETWMAVVRGIDRFDGRSTLRTWLYRILTNRAKTAGMRAARQPSGEAAAETSAVEPERFLPPDHPDWPGHWRDPPRAWTADLADGAVAAEFMAVLRAEIAELPRLQALVVTLRDVEGWTAAEVCNLLGLTETNQRVLLHRARMRLRGTLEHYMEGR